MQTRQPLLIVIDWGSTNCRAYLLDQNYQPLAEINQADGVIHHQREDYVAVCQQLLEPWSTQIQSSQLPLLMIGMIGSNIGWLETPYVSCPFNCQDLVDQAIHLRSPWQTPAVIIPGVKIENQQRCDVMRGEETLLLGVLAMSAADLICLPGTHTKWAYRQGEQYIDFRTAITGELYALLKDHSLLGQGVTEHDFSQSGFCQGVTASLMNESLLLELFAVRAKRLLAQLPPHQVLSYLSGLLVGSELRGIKAQLTTADVKVAIVTDNLPLANAYGLACHQFELNWQVLSAAKVLCQAIKPLAVGCRLVSENIEK